MRPLLLILLTLATAHSAEPAPASRLEPKIPSPAVVFKLGEAYVKSLPPSGQPDGKLAGARRDFERSFLLGFTRPIATIGNPNDAEVHGLQAGLDYRRAHPEALKEILEGYGYVATEADGVWRAGFEVSDFKPKENPNETWWITVLGDEGGAKARAERVHVERRVDGVVVHVSGFLSPEGHYGHFGVGQRELMATSITPAKGK